MSSAGRNEFEEFHLQLHKARYYMLGVASECVN